MLAKQHKLWFWCQKVLPLVYDDSLSYYELLCKVVHYLNSTTETINTLIDFYNTLGDEVAEIIVEMLQSGELDETIANALSYLIAEGYDPTKQYSAGDYVINDGKFYICTDDTTGTFDPTKWDEINIADELVYIKSVEQKNYLTVAEMKADTSLNVGDKAKTLGYYNANDKGGADYLIRANNSDVDNGGNIIILNNGNVAELIYNSFVNIRQFGVTGNATVDESGKVQKAIDYIVSCGGGKVIFNAPVRINSTVYINPGTDGVEVELCGETDSPSIFFTNNYYSENNIIKTTAGDLFSVNRQDSGIPFRYTWSRFSARNLEIVVSGSVNVTAFHCVSDIGSVFENISFHNVYAAIYYDFSYTNASNETVQPYVDFTSIRNCRTTQCKHIAYYLNTGDCKEVINSSCTWCNSGIKAGVYAGYCRNVKIDNFMWGNETNLPSSDPTGIIFLDNCVAEIGSVYAEYTSMPVVRAVNSIVECEQITVKFDYKRLFALTEGTRMHLHNLYVIQGVLTGAETAAGNGALVIDESNIPMLPAQWGELKITALNRMIAKIIRSTATRISFANINTPSDGYTAYFTYNNADLSQINFYENKFNCHKFKHGTLKAFNILSQNTNAIKFEVYSLSDTDLILTMLNPDGTTASAIPQGFEAVVEFFYERGSLT